MKKTVITLLALLVCSILPLHAYEYFTIYFSDGSKSEAFYATDVDSICYSKIGLDSIEYADWQVQEIYTCFDSGERICEIRRRSTALASRMWILMLWLKI